MSVKYRKRPPREPDRRVSDPDQGPPWVLEVRGPKGERIGVQTADALLRWQGALEALQAARSTPLSSEQAERARKRMDEIRKGYAVEMHRARQPSARIISAHLLRINRSVDRLIKDVGALIDRVQYPSAEDHMRKLASACTAAQSAKEAIDQYLKNPTVERDKPSIVETRHAHILKIAEIYREYAEGTMKVSNKGGKIGGKFMQFLFEAAQLCDNWTMATLYKDWADVRRTIANDPAWSGRI